MGDSWEEQAEVAAPGADKAGFSFNPSASSFSFNPTASSFKPPSEASPAAAVPPAAAEPQQEEVPGAFRGVCLGHFCPSSQECLDDWIDHT